MKQYIDKAAVVAEIERRVEAIRKAFNEPGILSGVDRTYACAQYEAFKSLLSFLDTLGVKKVDLEKEVNQYFEKTWPFEEDDEDIIAFAEYFFELGLKAQKGE